MKKSILLILVVGIILCLHLVSSTSLGYTDPTLPRLSSLTPTSPNGGGGNSTFNQTLGNSLWWALDGSNSNLLTSSWDMHNFDFQSVGKMSLRSTIFFNLSGTDSSSGTILNVSNIVGHNFRTEASNYISDSSTLGFGYVLGDENSYFVGTGFVGLLSILGNGNVLNNSYATSLSITRPIMVVGNFNEISGLRWAGVNVFGSFMNLTGDLFNHTTYVGQAGTYLRMNTTDAVLVARNLTVNGSKVCTVVNGLCGFGYYTSLQVDSLFMTQASPFFSGNLGTDLTGNIDLSAGVAGGNGHYYGDGSTLTGVCLTNSSNCNVTKAYYQNNQGLNTTSNVTFVNVSANQYNGRFNWIIEPSSSRYLNFNGTTLFFNESNANVTYIRANFTALKGDIIQYNGTLWKSFPRPVSAGSYYLTDTSTGTLTWALIPAATSDTWNTVLTNGATSSGVNPQLSTIDHLEFRDANNYLYSPATGVINVTVTKSFDITAPNLTMNGKIGINGIIQVVCDSTLTLGVLTDKYINLTYTNGVVTANTTCA